MFGQATPLTTWIVAATDALFNRGSERLKLGTLNDYMIRFVLPLVLVVLFVVALPDFLDEVETTFGIVPG